MLTEPWQWLLLILAAFCTGVAKSGFSGISLISVFILADLFGARASVGVALPMLIIGDLCVFPAYRKYGNWREVWIVLWPSLIGVAVAYWILANLDDNGVMRNIIGGIILSMVVLQLLRKWQEELIYKIAKRYLFSVFAGIAGGLATVLANAAGPINQLYLLSRNMSKMDLLGVGARFFLLINFIKLPFSAQLNLVNAETLTMNAMMIPVIVIGILLGKSILQKVPQKVFEAMIIVFALAASVRLLFF